MKTIYLPKNRQNKSNFKNALLVLGVFLVAFLILSIFKTSILFSISPFFNLRQTILNESEDLVSFFRSKDSLINENQFLKEQLRSQETLLVSFNALNKNYNDLLQNLGQLPKEVKVAAGVLTTPSQSLYDVLIIDAGKDKGVQIESPVTLPFGALIGHVTAVSDRTSQITLLSSYGIKTEAVLERSQTPVTLTGQGGGNFVIRVPRDIEVIKGDRVLSPGLNPRFLGTVEDISSVSTDSFKRVTSVIPGGIYQIRFVYILK